MMRIERLAWLSSDIALAVGVIDGEVDARSFGWLRPDSEPELVTAGRGALESSDLGMVTVDLQSFVRTTLAPLPAHTRADVLDFVAGTPDAHGIVAGVALTRALVTTCDALRERLVPSVVDRTQPIGLAAECVLAVDERRFFVQGWYRDVEAEVTSLRLVSPEGSRVELLPLLYRFRRHDLETLYGVPAGDPAAGAGFACCFDLPCSSRAGRGWVLELRDAAGNAVEAPVPVVVTSKDEVRSMLLGDVDLERPAEDTLTRRHLYPAISRLQEQNSARLRIDRVIQFGRAPAAPEVTIVVPLYRRIDLLQHQLASFSLDPEVARADLIYVLDSPEQAHELIPFAAALVDLYRIPFRVAILGQNVGFAGANRAGASLARGRLLVLMNSDVLPMRPGWLDKMAGFYDSKPRIGALGPKLLFEDESIQHAGLFFRLPANATFWENDHYFKGLHRDLAPASVSRPVPGVTAACLMVDRDLFVKVGGFSGAFVRGDYEDSDFCLRLIEAGCENWYFADVELYHLEGQSYESSLRRTASRYNGWLQTHIWGDRIAEVMDVFAPPGKPEVRMADLIPIESSNGGVVEVARGG